MTKLTPFYQLTCIPIATHTHTCNISAIPLLISDDTQVQAIVRAFERRLQEIWFCTTLAAGPVCGNPVGRARTTLSILSVPLPTTDRTVQCRVVVEHRCSPPPTYSTVRPAPSHAPSAMTPEITPGTQNEALYAECSALVRNHFLPPSAPQRTPPMHPDLTELSAPELIQRTASSTFPLARLSRACLCRSARRP